MSPSAACGRNQVEGFGWPRAVSRQLSALSIGTFVSLKTSLQNAKKLQRKKRDQLSAVSYQLAVSRQLLQSAC